MKKISNDINNNNKFKDLELCSHGFSSTIITYKSPQNIPSFKIKSLNKESVTSLIIIIENFGFSYICIKK